MDKVQVQLALKAWMEFGARCRVGQAERKRIRAAWEARVKDTRKQVKKKS